MEEMKLMLDRDEQTILDQADTIKVLEHIIRDLGGTVPGPKVM
jgi:hypothetical protein